jgi:hypothetical protein
MAPFGHPDAEVPSADLRDFEAEEDNMFYFDVDISTPLTGLIVAYRGALAPEQSAPTQPNEIRTILAWQARSFDATSISRTTSQSTTTQNAASQNPSFSRNRADL